MSKQKTFPQESAAAQFTLLDQENAGEVVVAMQYDDLIDRCMWQCVYINLTKKTPILTQVLFSAAADWALDQHQPKVA